MLYFNLTQFRFMTWFPFLLLISMTWSFVMSELYFQKDGFHDDFLVAPHSEDAFPSSHSSFSQEKLREMQDELVHDFMDPNHHEMDALSIHDYNKDGRLDGHELRFLFHGAASLDELNAMVQEILDMDDLNNDGYITRQELDDSPFK